VTEYRVILSGTSPAPGEVWSTGVSLQGVAPAMTQEEITEWATNIATALNAYTSANPLVSLLSSGGSMNTVRCELRDAATEELIRAGEAAIPTGLQGSTAANKVLQASVVFSLRTAVPGRSYRGRCYWPAWNFSPSAQLLFVTSTLPGYLTAFADLIELINAQAIVVDPSFAVILVVRSRLLHVSTPVTALAVGDVPDTQRRRRDAVNEQYTVLPV